MKGSAMVVLLRWCSMCDGAIEWVVVLLRWWCDGGGVWVRVLCTSHWLRCVSSVNGGDGIYVCF